MKYTILINQAGVVNVGLAGKTDVVDWALLDYIFSWQQNPNAQVVDGKTWLNYKHLISEMPLLGLNKKTSVANRIKKLNDIGLIETFQSPIDKRLFVKTTPLYYDASQFKGVPEKVQGVPEKVQGVPEKVQGVPEKVQGVPEKVHSYNHQDSLISIHKEILNTDISISTNSSGDLDGHSAKKFKKPTVLELEAFCNETHLNIDCQHFIDYYESNGWKVGKVAMKDWKATARNWARRELKSKTGVNNYAGNSKPNEKLCAADRIKRKAVLRKLDAERERNASTHDDNAIQLTDYHTYPNE